ncbi:MAG: cytochrome c [Spirochaetia bacterium]|nr:cytochrome c [Spirochaetia bacterium]
MIKTVSGGASRLRNAGPFSGSAQLLVRPVTVVAAAALIFVIACKKPPASAAERGRIIYQGTCIACHNMDPTKDGAVGPAIKGSSLELVTARVTEASYPPGYQPKRQTKLMPKQHLTQEEILAVYEFLK